MPTRAFLGRYGQTGSGKTYTLTALQQLAAREVFSLLGALDAASGSHVHYMTLCVFEMAGTKCFDLLNNHNQVHLREDENGKVESVVFVAWRIQAAACQVHVRGAVEPVCADEAQLLAFLSQVL